LDLYTDYLLSSVGRTTATSLSRLLDGYLSHDQISRLLSGNEFTLKDLWHEVKPLIRSYETDEACLIFDDTIIPKPYMDENEIICWHWDHCHGRNEEGINLLTAFYHSQPLHASEAFKTLYKKRWSVEEYHQSLEQNTSLAKSPARTVTTQSNHLFASLVAYI
jgi:hypothetical protein